MIQGGLVTLERVHDVQGNLENAYVKVCFYYEVDNEFLTLLSRWLVGISLRTAVR